MLLNADSSSSYASDGSRKRCMSKGSRWSAFSSGTLESLASTIVNMANGSPSDTESLGDRLRLGMIGDAVTDAYVDTYVAAQNLTVYHSTR